MIIAGIAEFEGGVVADRVVVWRAGVGAGDYVADTAPAADHSFSITVPDIGPYDIMIEKAGELSLMHGPVNAV